MTEIALSWNGQDKMPAAFFDVARAVYHRDGQWIPEDEERIRYLFSSKHQFFEEGIAWVGLEGTSRLAGFVHPSMMIDGAKTAYFGYWETGGSKEENQKLFAALESWTLQHSVSQIYGPINFSTYFPYRVKTAASLDYQPFIGEPYNAKSYQAILESLSYELKQSYISQVFHPIEDMIKVSVPKLANLPSVLSQGFTFEQLTREAWFKWEKEFHQVIDEIFSQNFAYSKISFDNFAETLSKDFATKLCPKTSFVVFKDREIASFLLNFPDYSPLAKQGMGKRVDVKDLDYAKHFRLLKDPILLIKTSGVREKYRSVGLHSLMAAKCFEASAGIYRSAIGCLIKEGNLSANYGKKNAPDYRRYGLFAKNL
jgi:hypothetical protein